MEIYERIKQSGGISRWPICRLCAPMNSMRMWMVRIKSLVLMYPLPKDRKGYGCETKSREELGFDALLGALKTGKIDLVISGMAVTEERLQEVDFSDPYFVVQQKVLVRKEDKNKFKTTADFFWFSRWGAKANHTRGVSEK